MAMDAYGFVIPDNQPFYGSRSTSSSQSTSEPFVPDLPQTPLLMEIAQYARNLAPTMLDWAQTAYARGEELSDDLLNQANIYASPGRIAQDMGQAQAHVMQGADQARQSALRDLEKYGIDPSSGRYAALDMAERNKAAAAAAGAGNMQRNATEAVGRELRRDAFAAHNANDQFGARAMALPNEYLKTAMGLKYPPMGQRSQSTSQGQSQSQQPGRGASATSQPSSNSARSGGPGGGGPGGFPGFPGGGSGGSSAPYSGYQPERASSFTPRGGSGGGAGILNLPGDPYTQFSDYGYYDPASYAQNSYDLPYNDPYYSPYSAYDPGGDVWGTSDYTDPFSGWGDQYTSGGGWEQGTSWDGSWGENPLGDDPYANMWDNADWGANWGDSGWGDTGGYQDYGMTDWSSGDVSGGYDSGWGDSGIDYSSYDDGGYDSYDWGGYDMAGWSGDYDYAQGGEVPTEGGFVSQELSPSGGAEVDDVNANLNAGEFVIPRDVAYWKGQEFFQKLIMKSRDARAGAPAKPTVSMG